MYMIGSGKTTHVMINVDFLCHKALVDYTSNLAHTYFWPRCKQKIVMELKYGESNAMESALNTW